MFVLHHLDDLVFLQSRLLNLVSDAIPQFVDFFLQSLILKLQLIRLLALDLKFIGDPIVLNTHIFDLISESLVFFVRQLQFLIGLDGLCLQVLVALF